MDSSKFSELNLQGPLLSNLASLGYLEMTPIQAQSLPAILAGKDLIGQAKTGSGKTAAFGLGILNKVNPRWFAVQGLVLCPTRELAEQVAQEIRRLARRIDNIKVVTLCGGTPLGPQVGSLEHGAHIVVGTPGRLHDHLSRQTLDLSTVNTLVLDEADRMIDMGFYQDIVGIVDKCPRRRQTLLFSATYPDNIRKQSARFLKNPEEVKVESLHSHKHIWQQFYKVPQDQKFDLLCDALQHFVPNSCLVFCNTKETVKNLARDLNEAGLPTLALYGDLEQRDRDATLVRFTNGSATVLVATDVAARGLDIQSLAAVVNYDLAHDPEVHIHRIGRTGRKGEKGLALSFAANHDTKRLQLIEKQQGMPVEWSDPDKLTKSDNQDDLQPKWITVEITGGKKDKIRPGDILGALTKDAGFAGSSIGKIHVGEFNSYIAVTFDVADAMVQKLNQIKIKGRTIKSRLL